MKAACARALEQHQFAVSCLLAAVHHDAPAQHDERERASGGG
ncbi:hypothetical protein [Paraburkholderia oxyphila]|nr:hypothetical protein [Paraburkholderia oxyphila]